MIANHTQCSLAARFYPFAPGTKLELPGKDAQIRRHKKRLCGVMMIVLIYTD